MTAGRAATRRFDGPVELGWVGGVGCLGGSGGVGWVGWVGRFGWAGRFGGIAGVADSESFVGSAPVSPISGAATTDLRIGVLATRAGGFFVVLATRAVGFFVVLAALVVADAAGLLAARDAVEPAVSAAAGRRAAPGRAAADLPPGPWRRGVNGSDSASTGTTYQAQHASDAHSAVGGESSATASRNDNGMLGVC
ncbi:MAG: hypothetical protein ABIO06_10700 [Pseudolysinimonas sp.]